jgi:predicted MFS family arabinose efflux permease
MALSQAAVHNVAPDRTGIASALLNTAQQLGAALGLAVLTGIAATVTAPLEYTGILLASWLLALAALPFQTPNTTRAVDHSEAPLVSAVAGGGGAPSIAASRPDANP